MYKVIIERRAYKEMDRLPRQTLSRIIKSISALSLDPRPSGVKKLFVHNGWRIRIGDYRVLYSIDDSKKVVAVYRIKHRGDVYR
ncbi:MAG: type II toxin-antitoxin system RelE/ParE family toxin [Candidatus Margulisiibacteriota bacterium]